MEIDVLHCQLAHQYAELVALMRRAEEAGEEELAAAILDALGALHGVLLIPAP